VVPTVLKESGTSTWWNVVECPFFRVVRVDLSGPETLGSDGRSFSALFVMSGDVEIGCDGSSVQAAAGTSCLVPAAIPAFTLTPGDAGARVILVTLG